MEDNLITRSFSYLKGKTLEDVDVNKFQDQMILKDQEVLFKIADVWANNRAVLSLAFQVRTMAMIEQIVRHASPAEVLVLREALNIMDLLQADLNGYYEERIKRTPPDKVEEVMQSLPIDP